MGEVTITTTGSFGPTLEQTFSAEEGGHANALARAIQYISLDLLPKAIQKDHKLHDEGVRPAIDFGCVR